jgi:hypothetical protein
MKSVTAFQHVGQDAFARYLTQTISSETRKEIEWHLRFCHVCREEITARDVVDTLRAVRNMFAGAGPSPVVVSDPSPGGETHH